jgi:hypothetical protein
VCQSADPELRLAFSEVQRPTVLLSTVLALYMYIYLFVYLTAYERLLLIPAVPQEIQ